MLVRFRRHPVSSKGKDREYPALRAQALLCVVVALLSGVVFTFVIHPYLSQSPGSLYTDESHTLALNILSGKGFARDDGAPDFLRNPVHPLVVAGVYWLFGPQLWPVQASNILFHTATAFVTFLIGLRVFGGRVGLFGGLATGVHPYLLWFLPTVMLRTMFILQVACLVLVLILMFERPRWYYGATAGAILGLATLTKAELLLFPIPLIALFAYVCRREGKKEMLAPSLWLAVAMLVVISPWIARNYSLTGRFIPGNLLTGYMFQFGDWVVDHDTSFFPRKTLEEVGESFWAVMRERKLLATGSRRFEWEGPPPRKLTSEVVQGQSKMSDLDWELYLQQEAVESAIGNPMQFVRKVAWQIPRAWYLPNRQEGRGKTMLLQVGQTIVLLPAMAGIFFSLTRRNTKALPIVLLICYFIGVYAAVLAAASYSTPILPYMLMFAVYGASCLISQLKYFVGRKALPHVKIA